MANHVKRSVLPIYLIGVSWLIYALVMPLRAPMQYVWCALVSVVVFVVAKAVFPDRTYRMPGDPAQEKKAKAEQPKKPQEDQPKADAPKAEEKPLSPEIAKLVQERDRALAEMRRLNDNIPDEKLSRQIDHLEEVTRKIIGQVVEDPDKLPQIRRFLDYYLPTTLKILNAYDRMGAVGVSGENIDATKSKVEGMMDTICQAFDKQLDALFGAEAMDISTDITVMEQLLAREGLSSGRPSAPKDDGDSPIELKL